MSAPSPGLDSINPVPPVPPVPAASSLGPNSGAASAVPNSAGFNPAHVPLVPQPPAGNPPAAMRRNNPLPAATAGSRSVAAPSTAGASAKPADSDAQVDRIMKEYQKAVEAGLETALADLMHRIFQLGTQIILFSVALLLTGATAGAMTPLLVWAAAGLGVACIDLGFSAYNLQQRRAGNDGLAYHGDSIACITAGILKKAGITEQAKIDLITNFVSNGIRCGLGAYTMPANHLHRPGGMGYMEYPISEICKTFAKKELEERKKDKSSLSLETNGCSKAAPSSASNPQVRAPGRRRPNGGHGGLGGNGGPNGGADGNGNVPPQPPANNPQPPGNNPPPPGNNPPPPGNNPPPQAGPSAGAGGTSGGGSATGTAGPTDHVAEPTDNATDAATVMTAKAAKNQRIGDKVADIKGKMVADDKVREKRSVATTRDTDSHPVESSDATSGIFSEQESEALLDSLLKDSTEKAEAMAENHPLTCRQAAGTGVVAPPLVYGTLGTV